MISPHLNNTRPKPLREDGKTGCRVSVTPSVTQNQAKRFGEVNVSGAASGPAGRRFKLRGRSIRSCVATRVLKSSARADHFSFAAMQNYFKTLGIGSFAGRMLTDTDDTPGAVPTVVMSYQAWQSNHGGDPHVLGSTFYFQGQLVTVVGIAPAGFFGDRIRSDPPELWIPLAAEPLIEGKNTILRVSESNWLYVLGRIKPGVSVAALQGKMSNSLRQWLATQPAYVRNGGATLVPKQHVVIVPGGASKTCSRRRSRDCTC